LLGVRLLVVEARDSASIGPAFDSLTAAGARAVLVGNHGLFLLQSKRIVALAESHRLPLFSPYPEARDAGVLLAGPPDFAFWSRRASVYVDRAPLWRLLTFPTIGAAAGLALAAWWHRGPALPVPPLTEALLAIGLAAGVMGARANGPTKKTTRADCALSQ
jgi:hypothetical protein